MMISTIEFNSKGEDFKACYRYEIEKFTITEFLRGMFLTVQSFDPQTMDEIYHCFDRELYILYGILVSGVAAGVCCDPYDKKIALAISDSIDELYILADLNSLTPISTMLS